MTDFTKAKLASVILIILSVILGNLIVRVINCDPTLGVILAPTLILFIIFVYMRANYLTW
jgi:hypothetical protein